MVPNKQKNSYSCELCNFISSNKTDYERHINTPKHHKNVQYHTNTHESSLSASHNYTCFLCKKEFKHRTSIYKHKNICFGKHEMTPSNTSHVDVPDVPSQDYITEVISKNQELTTANQELRSAMLLLIQQNTEFQSKMMELCKGGGISTTNVIT
jgi:MarR-like DNA-binding transcriptional regulator SgrR of sgrS sRNA